MKSEKKNIIIIFTRNPELGKVKTRLAKDLGDQAALEIYKTLLDHTKSVTKKIKADKSVWYSEKIKLNDIWDKNLYTKHKQEGIDLGERMHFAFATAFANGYQNVAIIGSDLYDLKPDHLNQAFEKLDSNEAVIGPAKDGGYYLLGLNSMITSVFKNKKWGSNSVLNDTLADLKNLKIHLLEELNDIDYAEDIEHYEIFKSYLKPKN